MFQTLDEAASFLRHKSVAMVDLKFCDLAGRWRHVTLPAGGFNPGLMESGVGFDGSSLGLTAVKSGDLVLVPELGTAFLDPFWDAPTISFLCAKSCQLAAQTGERQEWREHADYTAVNVEDDATAYKYVTETLNYRQMPVVVVSAPEGDVVWSGLQPAKIREHITHRAES